MFGIGVLFSTTRHTGQRRQRRGAHTEAVQVRRIRLVAAAELGNQHNLDELEVEDAAKVVVYHDFIPDSRLLRSNKVPQDEQVLRVLIEHYLCHLNGSCEYISICRYDTTAQLTPFSQNSVDATGTGTNGRCACLHVSRDHNKLRAIVTTASGTVYFSKKLLKKSTGMLNIVVHSRRGG